MKMSRTQHACEVEVGELVLAAEVWGEEEAED